MRQADVQPKGEHASRISANLLEDRKKSQTIARRARGKQILEMNALRRSEFTRFVDVGRNNRPGAQHRREAFLYIRLFEIHGYTPLI